MRYTLILLTRKIWPRSGHVSIEQDNLSDLDSINQVRISVILSVKNQFSVESTRKWISGHGQRTGATPNGNVRTGNGSRKSTKKDFYVASSSEATPFSRLECTSPQEDSELICKSDATPFSTP